MADFPPGGKLEVEASMPALTGQIAFDFEPSRDK